MATAPFQLWIDAPAVDKAVRSGSTITVTTSAAHGLVTGTYVQLEGFTGSAGTSMNGVYSATVTSGTTFTVAGTGTAGTATSGSAVVSRDLFSPVIDIASADKPNAAYVPLESITMSSSGDGNSSTFGFTVVQDQTPAAGPWWQGLPDQARVRLYLKSTGSLPADTDLYFIGFLASVNARLTDSGLGSIVDVSVNDVNALLDKIVVIGKPIAEVGIRTGGAVRSGSTVTITTSTAHGYGVGQQVQIKGIIGGGGNMNGTFTIATVPSTNTFTYTSSGTAGTGNNALTPSTAALKTNSKQIVALTFSSPHNLSSGDPVILSGFTGSTPNFTSLLYGSFSGSSMTVRSSTVIEITMASVLVNAQTVVTKGTVKGVARVIPTGGTAAQQNFTVAGGVSEDAAATAALRTVHQYKGDDPVLQRMFDTSTASEISGAGSTSANNIGVTIPSGSLRSILDGLVECYAGQDGAVRRYWIGLDRKLYYKKVNPDSAPSKPDAPYKIITSGTANPDTTSAAATIYPYRLEVAYDHNTTKSALFNISADSGIGASKVATYLDAGYTERRGAPILDGVVDYPTSTRDASGAIQRAAKAYFLEQSVQLQTITFTLRGAGKAAHNQYGFSAGYYETPGSSFSLQPRWAPGQWVNVSCAALNLSGNFRVEQVEWRLSPGSYLQEITITANRRNPTSLVDIVKRKK